MNQGGGGAQVVGGGDVADLVQQLQQQYPGAEIQVEGMTPEVAGPAASAQGDRVAQLERLAKLKESGALSEQEFEREKARILGE
jgi:Short C-terminal domain